MKPETVATPDLMAGRIRRLATIFNTLVAVTLLLDLFGVCTLAMPVNGDYFGGRIEVPAEIARLWPTDSHMGLYRGAAASMGQNWRPVASWVGFECWLALTLLIAVSVRNWGLYFVCQALLAIPPEPFGLCDPIAGATVTTIGAAIALTHCVTRRKFCLLGAVIAAAVGVFTVHAVCDGHSRFTAGNEVFAEAADNFDRNPEGLHQVVQVLAEVPVAQRPAADYVLAQIAYVRHDWAEVKRLTPQLRPDGFTQGWFTSARLAALRMQADGRTHLVPQAVWDPLATVFPVSVLLLIVSGIVLWRARSRRDRVARMETELAVLRRRAA